MIKELYQTRIRETALSISMSQIDSVRRKNITRSGCRVYAEGWIGISGKLGEPTDATWAAAEANLALKVPYPFEPEKNCCRTRDLRESRMSDDELIQQVEDLLNELRTAYPEFIYSNKVSVTETEIILQNDAGLNCRNLDRTYDISLLVKHKDSVSIFDTGIMRQDRFFNRNALLRDAAEMLGNFSIGKNLPARDKMLVVTQPDLLLGKLQESLNGEAVAREASLFCGKLGRKAFAESFTLIQDRTSEQMHVPFFDAEGVQNSGDKCALIQNGVIVRAYSDKKNASLLGEPTTGSATCAYDEAPALVGAPLAITPAGETLQELLDGEEALLVAIASGGDYTGQGDYASPVQLAMLTDGEHLLGRLPECNIRGNLFEMFGADFVGLSSDKALFGERALVLRMQVEL